MFERHKPGLLAISFIIVIALASGCKPAPTKSSVRELVAKDFESRNYKVTELEISDIRPASGEKRYMSRPAYIVDVPSITLEAALDVGNPVIYRKGQRLTFRNASIEIKEDLYQKGRWIITDIRGISVP